MMASRVATDDLIGPLYRGNVPWPPPVGGGWEGVLLDYKARLYDSSIGRFIQPDTIIPNPADPQGWNRYSYVQNRPVVFNDPSGHWLDEGCGSGKLCELAPAEEEKKPKEPPPQRCTPSDYECLVWEQIDQQFDPFAPFFGDGAVDYQAALENHWQAQLAYGKYGFDLEVLGAQGANNPLTVDMFEAADVDREWIELMSPSRRTPGQLFFLREMDLDLLRLSNYEPNFLDAVMRNNPRALSQAKGAYYNALIDINGDSKQAYLYLQLHMETQGTEW